MNTRVIAFYLPQFHTIPENDEWWGKGFTDWVNVRRARPLFAGHIQPKHPLDNNYYDLSKVETLRAQAALAAKYGVYGFCFYHYWFDGKLLLERPSERLLAAKDIPMRFCFSWANEPWARTWDGKNRQILMAQNYGREEEWKAHFAYLLPFFLDDRYIKVDGRPMFLIYKSQSIPQAAAMMALWERLAKEAGLPGLHFVETLRSGEKELRPLPFRARVEFEPARTLAMRGSVALTYGRLRRVVRGGINLLFHTRLLLNRPYTFCEVARRSLELPTPKGTYGGVFMGWDNSPRRDLASTIIFPPTKEEFADFLRRKIEKRGEPFVFVNAWNEWAEGTMLEPTEEDHHAYLEAIKETVK